MRIYITQTGETNRSNPEGSQILDADLRSASNICKPFGFDLRYLRGAVAVAILESAVP